MSTTEHELPAPVLEYLREHNTLTLATASPGGIPRAATFLYVNEGPSLYFWTRSATVTARHIQQNPLVSFTVDEYAGDLNQTRGVQGTGECSVLLSGEEIARVADLFGQKFPTLSPGATMSISFFRITPTEVGFIDNQRSGSASSSGVFGADFHRERSYSVLAALPSQVRETISASLPRVTVEQGEVMARQGGPADKFFIVVDGELEVRRQDPDAPETVSTLGPGELFGEMAILFDRPRSATITATQASSVLVVDRETFTGLMAQALGTSGAFDQVIRDRLETLRGAS
jgi:uncharacterized protein YhbP (UPF0306 family)